MATIDIYKGQIRLAQGISTPGAATLTGVARVQDRVTPDIRRAIGVGRNVAVTVRNGAAAGRTYAARVIAENIGGSTLTLSRPCPFT